MTRKRFCKLRNELARRIQLKANGNLKGFGKSLKDMRDKPLDFDKLRKEYGWSSYADVWNCKAFRDVREMVGM